MNLIKNIQGELVNISNGSILYLSPITGEVQGEDYINLNGFIAYLQNLTKVEYTKGLVKPLTFGLTNKYNKTTQTLDISY